MPEEPKRSVKRPVVKPRAGTAVQVKRFGRLLDQLLRRLELPKYRKEDVLTYVKRLMQAKNPEGLTPKQGEVLLKIVSDRTKIFMDAKQLFTHFQVPSVEITHTEFIKRCKRSFFEAFMEGNFHLDSLEVAVRLAIVACDKLVKIPPDVDLYKNILFEARRFRRDKLQQNLIETRETRFSEIKSEIKKSITAVISAAEAGGELGDFTLEHLRTALEGNFGIASRVGGRQVQNKVYHSLANRIRSKKREIEDTEATIQAALDSAQQTLTYAAVPTKSILGVSIAELASSWDNAIIELERRWAESGRPKVEVSKRDLDSLKQRLATRRCIPLDQVKLSKQDIQDLELEKRRGEELKQIEELAGRKLDSVLGAVEIPTDRIRRIKEQVSPRISGIANNYTDAKKTLSARISKLEDLVFDTKETIAGMGNSIRASIDRVLKDIETADRAVERFYSFPGVEDAVERLIVLSTKEYREHLEAEADLSHAAKLRLEAIRELSQVKRREAKFNLIARMIYARAQREYDERRGNT